MFLSILLVAMAQLVIVTTDTRILGGTGPAPCTRTCAGTYSGSWTGFDPGSAYVDIDITGCEFTTTPTITTDLYTENYTGLPGGHAVYVSSTRFKYTIPTYNYLEYYNYSASTMKSAANKYYKVNWNAVGYYC